MFDYLMFSIKALHAVLSFVWCRASGHRQLKRLSSNRSVDVIEGVCFHTWLQACTVVGTRVFWSTCTACLWAHEVLCLSSLWTLPLCIHGSSDSRYLLCIVYPAPPHTHTHGSFAVHDCFRIHVGPWHPLPCCHHLQSMHVRPYAYWICIHVPPETT